MRVGPLLCSPLAAVLCSHALAYPGPPRGTENIPKLMADSALVCKGEVVEAAEVTVVSDPRPPHRTDYRLFFLKPEEDRYVLVDDWFGQLSISRQLGATPFGDPDPMHRLEVDLKAGLSDHDHERVLDSIRMLGNMRHLQSKEELVSLLDPACANIRF